MATVFLLGPSEWIGTQTGPSPREKRRELAGILRNHRHRVILMEDELDRQGEDRGGKFDRLLRSSTDVVLYWPTKAKMSTTYTEMVLLRKAGEEVPLPHLRSLHHEKLATIQRGVLKLHEPDARSRYLT